MAVEKKNNMWRDTVANEASSTTGEIRRILSGSRTRRPRVGWFCRHLPSTYLLLAMVRPRAVVYKRGEGGSLVSGPGLMLWALAAGTVGIGLCLVDR